MHYKVSLIFFWFRCGLIGGNPLISEILQLLWCLFRSIYYPKKLRWVVFYLPKLAYPPPAPQQLEVHELGVKLFDFLVTVMWDVKQIHINRMKYCELIISPVVTVFMKKIWFDNVDIFSKQLLLNVINLRHRFHISYSALKQPTEVFCKKKVFLEILWNWQENSCARDSFLTKLQV